MFILVNLILFTWFFALAGKRFLTCPTFLHCCDRATTYCFKCFYSSSFASVPDFKHLLYIMMFVLVKNMLAVLKWLLANNACSFVDLLWRRKFGRKSTCPKFSEIQEKQP